ncbi:uncharacterized protein Dwil_GK13774 [Drosophila willistoni]|uniref:BTB domain-containing protein n=1 Tax=Drosophila willistoni TaxID=7260 RepID=B4NIN4_DROWI|nr:uncharacterized protein Dwil_GK13774 [Drosophila willistoni]
MQPPNGADPTVTTAPKSLPHNEVSSKRQSILITATGLLLTYGGMDLAQGMGWNLTSDVVATPQFRYSWSIGVIIGCLLGSLAINRFTKVYFYIAGGILELIDAIIFLSAPYEYSSIVAARYIGGIGIGIVSLTFIIHNSEISVQNSRGLFACKEILGITLGITIQVVYDAEWLSDMKMSENQAHGIFGVIFSIGALASLLGRVESPIFLIRQNEEEKARASMQRIVSPLISDELRNELYEECRNYVIEGESQSLSDQLRLAMIPFFKLLIYRAFVPFSFSLPLSNSLISSTFVAEGIDHSWQLATWGVLHQFLEFEVPAFKDMDDPGSSSDIIVMNHSKPVTRELINLIQNGLLTDVVINVRDREFQCHSIVLHIYSKRLKPYLHNPLIIIKSSKLTPRGFSLAYQWMIAKYGVINANDVTDLLRAAIYLEMPDLLEHCWETLDFRIFNEFTAFDLMYQARKVADLVHLNEPMALRISRSFLTIVSSSEFVELSETQMCTLLSSCNVAVNAEIEVLYSALLWLNHQWPMRQDSVGSIMKNIRFGYLAPTILSKFKTNDRYMIGPFGHILDHFCTLPQMSKLIQDGLFYSSLVITAHNDPKNFRATVHQNKLTMCPPRCWMRDGRCSYHRPICISCPNMRHLSYEDFANYLQQLQAVDDDFDSQMSFAHSPPVYDWHHEYVSSPSSLELFKKCMENCDKPAKRHRPGKYFKTDLQSEKYSKNLLFATNKWNIKCNEDDEDFLKMGEDTIDLLNKALKE